MILSLFVLALVLFLMYWVLHQLAGVFGAPPVILTLIDIFLVIMFALYLIQFAGGSGPLPPFRIGRW